MNGDSYGPDNHLGHFVVDVLKERPDDICQIDAYTREKETRGSVLSRSIQLARCLRRLGLRPGDVLSLSGNNHLDIHIPYYAAHFNGYPVVGIDPLFKYTEIKAVYRQAEPKVVFCQNEGVEEYKRAVQDLGLDSKIITFDDSDCSLRSFLQEYDDHSEDNDDFKVAEFDCSKIYAWLVSTSGSTGMPKVAAFSHESILNTIKLFRAISTEKTNAKPGLHLSPTQWISGYFNAISMPMFKSVKVQTSGPATVEHFIDVINEHKPGTTTLSPTIVNLMLKSEKHCDFTCFDRLCLAGAKMPTDVMEELKARMRPDAVLLDMYGQTENLGPALMPNPRGPAGNCGTPGLHSVKLVDPETEEEITKPNVPGELWTKGPRFVEYYKNPEETKKAFSPDGWYKTGDLLYRDESNNYFFVERLKMLMKCKGHHIVPMELEQVICAMSGVVQASVTSVPDEEFGELPVACVVRAHRSALTAQDIKDEVANKLSEMKQLRGGVVFLDSLPLTSTGKVQRALLKQIVLKCKRE